MTSDSKVLITKTTSSPPSVVRKQIKASPPPSPCASVCWPGLLPSSSFVLFSFPVSQSVCQSNHFVVNPGLPIPPLVVGASSRYCLLNYPPRFSLRNGQRKEESGKLGRGISHESDAADAADGRLDGRRSEDWGGEAGVLASSID